MPRLNSASGPMVRTITVYRDDPVWDKHARWFNVPTAKLEELWVTRYDITGEWIDESDMDRHANEVEQMHPGCVLVY